MSRVLVTGATGHTGSLVAVELAARGVRVRAASRKGALPVVAGREVDAEPVRFDWHDEATHEAALRDVDAAYLVAPALVTDPSPVMVGLIDRARAMGVRRFVLLSTSAIDEQGGGLGRVHRALLSRAPEWSVLRPSWFMQNFVDPAQPHARSLRERGVMVTATGDGRIGFVDAADIAAVAVRALIDVTPHNTAHLITGPEALRYDDVAAILSEVTGRPLHHEHVSRDEVVARLVAFGIPSAYAELLAGLDEAIRAGAEARVTDVVREVTGRAPRSLRAFARAHAGALG